MADIIHKNNNVFLSKEYIKYLSIDIDTINSFFKRRKNKLIRDEHGVTYINYDSIPVPTRKKLPSKTDLIAEYNLQVHDTKVNNHYEQLLHAQSKGYIQHIDLLKEKYPLLSHKKIIKACKLYACWQYVINDAGKDGFTLYKAFDKVYPKKYENANSFYNCKSKAVKEGAEIMAIDMRWFTTPKNIKTVNVVNRFWASSIISIGKKYSNRKVWERLCLLCNEANEKAPSKGWVDKYRKQILKSNISVYKSRNGIEAGNAKQLSFATMETAQYANDQWQMDGWTLPFWGQNFLRYTIVIIRDAYSKKIVGSAVGESENTLIIMAALKDAITNTGYLPYEILTDNHSFNQTKEAANFKEEIANFGTQFTVTHSPTHKSIIERYNRHLDDLCKDYYGYLGEGIKSKNIDAHPSQKLIDEYAKNFLSANEIKSIGISIVNDFNKKILPKYEDTPDNLYEKSEKLHCFKVTVFDRAKILLSKTECKISRGQITIKRGLAIHEFQLPAELYAECNNTKVIVRYEDLNEGVYLYNYDTDEAITELKPKPKIHGAKANQTEHDIELLNKNKGRIKGIENMAKQKNQTLLKQALTVNPEAVNMLNKITTPKNVLKEFEQKEHLRKIAEEKGINLNLVHIPDRKNEVDNEDLKPVTKTNDSPFTPKNHTIKKINLKDFYEE